MSVPGMVQTATLPEIHQRTNAFVARWRGESRERAEKDTFWNEFLAIFGLDRRRYGVFEFVAQRYSTGRHGFIDLLVPGQMAVEHKSRGQDLTSAMYQLVDYLHDMKERDLPHTLVVCDFDEFVVRDLRTSAQARFPLQALPQYVDRFAFLAGHRPHDRETSEEEANVKATKLLGQLHDSLEASGYGGHSLRVFLVRLLYILFADDTQIWSRNLFYDWLVVKTAEDGSDLGSKLNELFGILDTPQVARQSNLDADLAEFAYINGGLFQENLRPPTCDAAMRDDLLAACLFDWSRISPAIFGSLFQNVMDKEERRHLGAHYTTERDIMRTIRPLFLDALESRFDRALAETERRARLRTLSLLRNELGTLRFLDPACGCGNFLILAYRELRRLELKILLAIRENEAALEGRQRGAAYAPSEGQAALDVTMESQVTVDQFYGIEIEEFPARIAETAMHLVDHQANLELSKALGEYYVRLPIADTAHISVRNALRMDWNQLLPADDCSFILGNPPFSGQYTRTDAQTEDLKYVWGAGYNGYLDYVTGWYVKAREYVGTRSIRVAFVSTNSVCQGEAVPHLWEPLFRDGFAIDFAHRTFLWTSEASGRAGVHVVIVGWSHSPTRAPRTLYDYPVGGRGEPRAVRAGNINAYLADAPNVFVRPRTQPLAVDLPAVVYGSKPTDGGHLMVTPEEYATVNEDPIASKYLRRFIGAKELLYDTDRWCFWLTNLEPSDLRASPVLRERLEAVAAFRRASSKPQTAAAAVTPGLFQEIRQPSVDYLGIPAHVGESRRYFPVQRFSADVIAGNHNFIAPDPDGLIFAALSSSMFVTWLKGVAGRIRADPRFSGTGVWNTFPLPSLSGPVRHEMIEAGRGVLEARKQFVGSSLADLYDSLAMPKPLIDAHRGLDAVVDRALAQGRRVQSDGDRLSVMFDRYVELESAGQLALQSAPKRRRKPT